MKLPSQTDSSASLLTVLLSGCVTGILQVSLSISYAALVYGGVLSQYVGQGIGFALLGALVIATTITLFAAWPGTVGSNQDVSVAIFSIISTSIVASMPYGSTPEGAFSTVVVAISLAVLFTGLFFWGLGWMRLGGLIRYFPYPVIGGFLAGTGWLLFIGGFSLVNGDWSYRELFQTSHLVHWLPSLLFSIVLLLAAKKYDCSVTLPGIILFGILAFYGATHFMGISIEELSAKGLLLGPFSDEKLWQPFTMGQLALVDWSVIAGQALNAITVVSVSSIALLLNASAFELEARRDVDLNKELRLAGFANFLSCFAHGFVGFRQLSLTVLNYRMKAHSRLVGLIGVVILALTLTFGTSLISFFPKAILGGLLMYLGLTFLVEWAYETYYRLPKIDFAIIWMVFIVIATVGFIPGVGVGLFAAVIMFVVSYSRTEVVRHEFTGKNYQSLNPRSFVERQVLTAQGESLYVLQLQGFIFFGTANRLFNKIKEKIQETSSLSLNYVILDFKRIDILDSTGMLSFRKLKYFTNLSNTHLIITSPSCEIQQQLITGGLNPSDLLTHYFPSLNSGVLWCEEQMLQRFSLQQDLSNIPLVQQFAIIHPTHIKIDPLMNFFEPLDIEPGATIISAGEAADGFFFIESGRVIAKAGRGEYSESLETIKNGSAIGDICFYLGTEHVADVIASEQCRVYKMSTKKLIQLEQENPEIAASLHRLMARLLAERIIHLNKTISVLQK